MWALSGSRTACRISNGVFGELWCIDPECYGINTGDMDGWDKRIMIEDEWGALQKTLLNTIRNIRKAIKHN